MFRNFVHFCEDIRSHSLKIVCPRSQQLREHANFSSDTEIFIFLNYCYYRCVYKPKYLFSPVCSFEICEKPLEFSKNFHVIFVVYA